VTPAAYLRTRRAAAGLTLDAAACALAPRIADRRVAYALLRLWETDGVVGEAGDVARLRTLYPFDVDVYRQLAEEPADRHPTICTGCGCTQNDACIDDVSTACHWVADDLCSACEDSATRSSVAWMYRAIVHSTDGEGATA
jgi:hypothetical protein